MFDIGFWELMVIAIVGLLVIGPEKLPEVIREIMAFIRKVKLMLSDARASLEREIDLDEIRKLKEEINMRKYIDDLNDSILAAERDGKDLLAEMRQDGAPRREQKHDYLHQTDGEHDGFSAEDAEAEADTGIEPPINLTKPTTKDKKNEPPTP